MFRKSNPSALANIVAPIPLPPGGDQEATILNFSLGLHAGLVSMKTVPGSIDSASALELICLPRTMLFCLLPSNSTRPRLGFTNVFPPSFETATQRKRPYVPNVSSGWQSGVGGQQAEAG
jgi:hypothetical protein